MSTLRTLTLASLSFSLASCVIQSEKYTRPRDLSPGWLVDRTRVLGIRAEPPEVTPGQEATFQALIPDPEGGDLSVIWLACPLDPEDGGIGFGCELDFGAVDFETAPPEELEAIGFIGFEPFIQPAYTPDATLLEGLDLEARSEGVFVLIQVSALPPEVLEEDVEEVDFNAVEAGYKRLVVSEAATPNHNPALADFTVDGHVAPAGTVVKLDAGQDYELAIGLQDDGIEAYTFLNSSGVVEDRVEEPYAKWYSTGGTVNEEITLHPFMQSTWTAPEEEEDGTWFTVVRDRRGGISWREVAWTTRP